MTHIVPLLSDCQVHRAPYQAQSPGFWRKMRTSSSVYQPENTEGMKDSENTALQDCHQCFLTVQCQSAAALFSSDHIGGEEPNCWVEKAVAPPPSPLPFQSLFAQHGPFHSFPAIPFLLLLVHAVLLRMPKPMSKRSKINRKKKILFLWPQMTQWA